MKGTRGRGQRLAVDNSDGSAVRDPQNLRQLGAMWRPG